jgi:hypothetical protein
MRSAVLQPLLFHPICLIRKEVKNVAKRTCIGFIHFGEFASLATNGRIFLILDVEYFGKPSTCSCKLIGFKFCVLALGAFPVFVLHYFTPIMALFPFLFGLIEGQDRPRSTILIIDAIFF